MAELRADVVAQIEELSTLVGDLVDLTRDDAGGVVHEPVDMSEVVDRSLERVRRRRNDIEFDVDAVGWQVYGDAAGLSRAVLNLLDNAAKWSPPGGRVGLRLRQVDAAHAELVVSDHGPGSRHRSAIWSSSGSTGRPPRGRCPVPVWAWRSSSRWWSSTGNDPDRRHGSRRAAPGTSFYVLLPGPPSGPRRPWSPRPSGKPGDGSPPWPAAVAPRRRIAPPSRVLSQSILSRNGQGSTNSSRISSEKKEQSSDMTDQPRYSSPPQPGNPVPHQQAPRLPAGTPSGRLPAALRLAVRHPAAAVPRSLRPVPGGAPTHSGAVPTMVAAPPRQRSRAGALTAGALAIAVVSAGVGGTVVLLAQPDREPLSRVERAAPSGPNNVPAANLPIGSVEQVAAKVVPSVVKLETEMGRQSEEGSGIILSADGLILTNNHVVAAAKGQGRRTLRPGPALRCRPGSGRPGADRPGRWRSDHDGHLRRRPRRTVHRHRHRSGQ